MNLKKLKLIEDIENLSNKELIDYHKELYDIYISVKDYYFKLKDVYKFTESLMLERIKDLEYDMMEAEDNRLNCDENKNDILTKLH